MADSLPYTHLYTDDAGVTHFTDAALPWQSSRRGTPPMPRWTTTFQDAHSVVRAHRVATRSRRRSQHWVFLAPRVFSSGAGLAAPVYHIQPSDSIGCRLERSWNRDLSPRPPSG